MKCSCVFFKNYNSYGNAFHRFHRSTSGLSPQFFQPQDPQCCPPTWAQKGLTTNDPSLGAFSSYYRRKFAINCRTAFWISRVETFAALQNTPVPLPLGQFQEHFRNRRWYSDKDIKTGDCISSVKYQEIYVKLGHEIESLKANRKCDQLKEISISHNGVMQESRSSTTTSTSAFLANNIFTNFSNFIDSYGSPLGKGHHSFIASHPPSISETFDCNDSTIQSTANQNAIVENITCVNIDPVVNNVLSKVDESCLELNVKFRKEMEQPLESERSEKTYFLGTAVKTLTPRSNNFGSAEGGKSPSNNEFETENFSSVFAKSLTFLYPSEPDNSYDNEVAMKCDVPPSVAMDTSNELNGSSVRGCKNDAKTLASDDISDHSFDSAFRNVDQRINPTGVKMKLGRTTSTRESSDSGRSFGEGRFNDNTFSCGSESLRCYQYDPFDVTNSFYGSRDVNPALNKTQSGLDGRPELCARPNPDSAISGQECSSNSPGDSRAKALSRKARYDATDRFSGKRTFRSMRLKGMDRLQRRSSPSGFCTRSESYSDRYSEEMTEKRVQKRISALSVYTKVQEDVIVSVMCKRFKKRTKPMGVVDEEADNCSTSVPLHVPQNNVSATFNRSSSSCHQEDHSEVDSAVKTAVNQILGMVSQRNNEEPNTEHILEEMNSETIRELVVKLCLDYSFDRRDFEDVDLVTTIHVVEGEKQEVTRRRGRKRQRICPDKGNRTRSEASSAEATDHTPEVNNRTAIHRILRSLPSRQNMKPPRTNGTHLNSTRVISPSSLVEHPCTVIKSSECNRDDGDSQDLHNQLEPKTKVIRLTNEEAKDTEARLVSDDCIGMAKTVAESECNNDEPSYPIDKCRVIMDFSEDTSDNSESASVLKKNDDSLAFACSSEIPNNSMKRLDIYKPPELVRMGDDGSYFEINKEYDESNHQSEGDRFSPSYLTANGIRENSETPPSEPAMLQGQNHSLPNLDDSEEELVIDTSCGSNESHANGDLFAPEKIKRESSPNPLRMTPPSSERYHHQMNQDDQISHEKTHSMEGMDDDCVILPSDEEENVESFEKSNMIVKKEIFPNLPPETQRQIPVQKPESPSKPSPLRLKPITKEERDESILRNLLLDPSESIPNAPAGNNSQDLPSPILIATNSVNLTRVKVSLPSSPNRTDDEVTCGRSSMMADNISPFLENSGGVFRAPDVNHVPNHQPHHRRGDIAKFSHSLPSAPPGGDSQCDLNSVIHKVDITPPRSPLPGEVKDNSWTKDSDQLKDKIKKLKNEIVYLQMMAEQKEKEKTAIICFKKYKEEILRRICKAYQQNQARDIPFPDQRRRRDYPESHFTPSSTAQLQRSHFLPPRYSNPNKLAPPMSVPDPKFGDVSKGSASGDKSSSHLLPHANYHPNGRPEGEVEKPMVKPNHISGDKLPAVEAMVAEASDNYGVDMRSGKKDSCGQSRAESVNAILRKALSIKESGRATVADGRWPTDGAQYHSKVSGMKTNPQLPTRFLCDQDPLDRNGSRRALSVCSSSTPTDMTTVHNSNCKPHFDAHMKRDGTDGSVYNSWNMQMNRNRVDGLNKLRNHVPQPIASRSNDTMKISSNFVGPRHDIPERNPALHVPPSTPMKNVASHVTHHRGHPGSRNESSLNVVLDRIYSRKTEERKNSEFPPMMSANGTMPYGGRMVRGETPASSLHTKNSPPIARAGGPATCPPCMGCGISDAKFLCSGCRKHWYCSPQCQSLRWPEHSQVCSGRVYAQAPPGHFS